MTPNDIITPPVTVANYHSNRPKAPSVRPYALAAIGFALLAVALFVASLFPGPDFLLAHWLGLDAWLTSEECAVVMVAALVLAVSPTARVAVGRATDAAKEQLKRIPRARLSLRPGWGSAVVAVGFAIGALYAFATPSLQGGDEEPHLRYVNWIAKGNPLPNQYVASQSPSYEGLQFPSYYILTGHLVGWLSNGDGVAYAQTWTAPGRVTWPHDLIRARFQATKDRDLFYILRLLGALCFALTIGLIVKIGGRVWPTRPCLSLASAAGAMLIPQLAFTCATVNNDGLVILMSTAAIYWAVRLVQGGGRWSALAFGLFAGLALAVKKDALFLFAAAPVIVWAQYARYRVRVPEVALRAALSLALLVLAGGWVFWRNHVLYGSFLADDMERQSVYWIVHNKSITDPYFVSAFPAMLYRSFFAHFGQTVVPPAWIYDGYGLLIGASLVGLVAAVVKKDTKAPIIALGVILFAALLAGAVIYNLHFTEARGRFLFPAISVIALLVTLGVERLASMTPRRVKVSLVAGSPAYLLLAAIVCFTALVGQYYGASTVPKPITIAEVGDSITLGWDEQTSSAAAGGYRPILQSSLQGAVLLPPTAHVGYTIDQITDSIGLDMREKPDVVLLEAGTNDALKTQETPEEALSHLRRLVKRIKSDNPRATICVSTLPPLSARHGKTQWVNTFNRLLPSFMPQGTTVANIGGSLSQNDLGPLGIHPVPAGYSKMADGWKRVVIKQADYD